MNNHRRVMQIPSPRYFLDMDYLTETFGVLRFEDVLYSYTKNEWMYDEGDRDGLTPESELTKCITEDEERRVQLDYEREEMHKQKLYKKIGIF